MKIAIVHYHLRIGGVSRVIELTCKALREFGFQVAVLAGDIQSASGSFPKVPMAALSKLDYQDTSSYEAEELQQELEKAARRLLGGSPDIWHVHNHSLGKNPALPKIVTSWVERGEALLLQIHDFAENRRPKNYLRLLEAYGKSLDRVLYPSTSRVAYAVLNSRDERHMRTAGFSGQIFRLPNPVTAPFFLRQRSAREFGASALIVYPCRAIWRKNIGEALLLACAFPEGRRLAFALGPNSAEDVCAYQRWKTLANSLRLPVEFEVCAQRKIPLGDLVSASECLLTTSIEEGFGMAFLESWLSDKSLIGRDIPAITSDFRQNGLRLDSLYDFLGVPVSLIGRKRVEMSLLAQLRERFSLFGASPDEASSEQYLRRVFREGQVDFGQLTPSCQEQVLRLVATQPSLAGEILNELPPPPGPEVVQFNKQVVENQYSLEQYGERLTEIYRKLASARASPVTFGNSQGLLREFLAG